MMKAEMFLFANLTERLARHDNNRSRQLLWPHGCKDLNSSELGNLALLQSAINGCNSFARFIVSQTVACSKTERVERSRGDNAPIGKCLLISCDERRRRLTHANIVAQLTSVAWKKPSPLAANRKRLILHTTISRGQYFFLPNRVRFFKSFLAFWSSPGKGGIRHGKKLQRIG